jgi:TIR domain-containing protein
MADIFLSYANADRDRARELASSLERRGWSVWWDRKIIAGKSFDQVIEHELGTAKSVVVLWSKDSIVSEWVKNEAAVAVERGVLVPALVDRVQLPLEFRRKQAADLVGWDGDPSHEGFQAMCDGVGAVIDAIQPTSSTRAPRSSGPSGFKDGRKRWTFAAIALAALAVVFGVYWHRIGAISEPSAIRQPVSNEASKSVELADLVAGTYDGDVVADSKGPSRSDVTVTIARVNKRRVRITSDYDRLGTLEVDLTRVGNTIQCLDCSSLLALDLDKDPPVLAYNPKLELAYVGQKR